MSTVNRKGAAQDRYFELVRQFPLRPLRSDEGLDEAVQVVDSLVSKPSLSQEEQDYLEVLGGLVEAYETEVHPMPPLPDAELLRHLIDAKGVSQTEVAEGTGIADSTISEVLKGKRFLNRVHIAKLSRYFKVSADVFSF
jgi:HTH-type transcriptional regulator/antitoxin HigA